MLYTTKPINHPDPNEIDKGTASAKQGHVSAGHRSARITAADAGGKVAFLTEVKTVI